MRDYDATLRADDVNAAAYEQGYEQGLADGIESAYAEGYADAVADGAFIRDIGGDNGQQTTG